MRLALAAVPLGLAIRSASAMLVQVEQYGMAQCPMTSTLTTDFFNDCFVHGYEISTLVNYTLNMVGGSHGGPLGNSTTAWNSSFHGNQEIVADKYQLCSRDLEQKTNPTTATNAGGYQWVNFTSCLNGYQGIAICTYYLPHEIPDAAKVCAEATGFNWHDLYTCVNSQRGTDLYKASVEFTSDQMAKKTIPPYGTGKDQGIPIIRIAGTTYKGTIGAFNNLGKEICKAAGKGPLSGCGCFRTYPPPQAADEQEAPKVWSPFS